MPNAVIALCEPPSYLAVLLRVLNLSFRASRICPEEKYYLGIRVVPLAHINEVALTQL